MISIEQRPALAINVVTRSGATTHIQNMEKQPDEAWVHKAPQRVPAFDIQKEKETFMETRQDFGDSTTAVAPAQPHQQQSRPQEALMGEVSTLSSFLQSCMKLLRNQNVLKELQKVLAFC